MFNKGFLCSNCGPIPKAKKRSINKVQHNTCPECLSVVTEWERPLNERSGHCNNCGNGGFVLALHKGNLLRKCKKCSEVYNLDKSEIIRKGE